MSWLRLLTRCDPPDHLLRNAVMQELHAQMVGKNLRNPFTELAPDCGIREVDWKGCKPLFEEAARTRWQPLSARVACGPDCKVVHCERDDSSQWSDCTSGATDNSRATRTPASSVASGRQGRHENAGMGDAREEAQKQDKNPDNGSPRDEPDNGSPRDEPDNGSPRDEPDNGSPRDSIGHGSSIFSYFPPDTPSCRGAGEEEGEAQGGSMCSSCMKLPDRAVLVQHYETIVAQLRADLLREKTVSFQSINEFVIEQKNMEDKITELESQRKQLEISNRDTLERHKQSVGQVTYRLGQIQELYGEMEERLRDATGRLEELEGQKVDVSKQLSGFIQESRQIFLSEVEKQTSIIRQEFTRRLAKREAHLTTKLSDLRKTIRCSADAKQMWTAEYERRIRYAELEKDFEMKRMNLQLQSERQELETVARKFRQGDLQRIKQLEDRLQSLEKT